MTRLLAALRQTTADLDELGQHWALIGGLAASVRAEPRTTRDIDLVVAVRDDTQAERLVRDLRAAVRNIVLEALRLLRCDGQRFRLTA